ncbi:MAG: hypothetical protein ACREMC_02750 [Gemmatimonadales bacterium]
MDESIPVSVPGREGVIFPAAHVSRHLDSDGGAWTPAPEDIADAEQRLPGYLATATPPLPAHQAGAAQRIAARLDRYARQYFGVSWRGRRYLYINCLPATHSSDWRAQPMFVKDGGESFFHLLYDPESREFSALSINGEA